MFRALLLFPLLFGSSLFAARLEFLPGHDRIHWRAHDGSVYLIERSGDLRDWEPVSPVFVGADADRVFDAALVGAGPRFYRLFRVAEADLIGSVVDGERPDYLGWAAEGGDGSLRFDFYPLRDSDFVDVHYRVNGGGQLNHRMARRDGRWRFETPPLNVGDEVSFYFTYDRGGAAVDTAAATYVMGDGAGNGGGDPGGGETYEDVLPAPNTAADYTHGISFAGGEAVLRVRPGVDPSSLLVHYSVNGGPEQAQPMTQAGDEWRYAFPATEGDQIAYAFHSVDPNHIRSRTFTRRVGEPQPEREEPQIILAAGRFRDRHENERRFDPFVENYFDRSYFGLTLYDYGDGVDVAFDPAEPMNFVDIKLFDRLTTPHEERGLEVRADYAQAHRMFPVGDQFFWRVDPVEPGQFVDLEFTLQRTRTGQQYYTAIFRFYVGEGALTPRIEDPAAHSGGATTVDVYAETAFSFAQAAHNARPDTLRNFLDGKRVFDREFSADEGLGPLYNARSCFECHVNDGSAQPPAAFDDPMTGMLFKLREPGPGGQAPHPDYGAQLQDRAIDGEFAEGRGHVRFTETTGSFDDGAAYALATPDYSFSGLRGPTFRTAVVSPRVAPKLIGLGLLEAIPASTLESWADPGDADGDGVSGRINGVVDPETGRAAIGRFGWKASQPTVRAQVGLALSEDMGLGNPVYPQPGLEVSPEEFNDLALYAQTLGVPLRRRFDEPEVLAGERLFAELNCVACHKPVVTTGGAHPIVELRNQTIHPYTDLLLHDMGPALGDELEEGAAIGQEWRTPPLWGIGRTEEVSGHTRYLHDGRARSLEEAILWHGGEAFASRDAYEALSADERAQLLAFLRSL